MTSVRQVDAQETFVNDPETIFKFCDVTATAEILFNMMIHTKSVGVRAIEVSVSDIADVLDQTARSSVQSEAFTHAFMDDLPTDRFSTLVLCCQDLIERGWLQYGRNDEQMPENFGNDPEIDKLALVRPTSDFMRMMEILNASE